MYVCNFPFLHFFKILWFLKVFWNGNYFSGWNLTSNLWQFNLKNDILTAIQYSFCNFPCLHFKIRCGGAYKVFGWQLFSVGNWTSNLRHFNLKHDVLYKTHGENEQLYKTCLLLSFFTSAWWFFKGFDDNYFSSWNLTNNLQHFNLEYDHLYSLEILQNTFVTFLFYISR